MSLGLVRHNKKKIQRAGKSVKTEIRKAMVDIWVQRDLYTKAGPGYLAGACLGKKRRSGGFFVPRKCARAQEGKTPTAAIKKALHNLASKLK
jgi:hypothetical protein